MKLILILLIINWIFGSKKPSGYLCCGLFGWVGKNPSTFNRHAFAILGLDNENRGGDSCGIYANKEITYGTGYTRDFKTFIKKVGGIRTGKDCVVLGHTRRASIGSIIVGNAQPIGLMDKDNLGFVLTHNGTLTNHEELAKKYGLSTENLNTDSQILAALIFQTKAGWDVLGEYNGGAAVVFHYPDSDSIFIFKGESNTSSNTTFESEERPLYGYQESDYSFYYSSTKSPLEIIAKDTTKIFDIKCNILFRVTAGKFEEVIKIDRSKRYQRYIEPYVKTNRKEYRDAYGYNDDHNGYMGREWEHPKNNNYKSEWCSPHKTITDENLTHLGNSMITLTKGRYHLGENLAHGKVIINDYGLIVAEEEDLKFKYVLFFWEGILLYGIEEYATLLLAKKDKKYVSIFDNELTMASPYPMANYNNTTDNRLYTSDSILNTYKEFSGKWSPVFSSKEYYCTRGLITRITSMGNIRKLFNEKIELLDI